MTFWLVEPSGRGRALRPYPPDVRWAPRRPPYPPGLSKVERREWTDRWYSEAYFGWKESVIEAIAVDPQAAANAFERLAPVAEWPEPTKKRPRERKPAAWRVSAKQRQVQAERLLASALARAGMSERAIASEMGVPKTTVHRRLDGEPIADALAGVMLEVQVSSLLANLMESVRTARPEDAPRLRQQLDRIARMQLLAAGERPSEVGVFGPRLAGDR